MMTVSMMKGDTTLNVKYHNRSWFVDRGGWQALLYAAFLASAHNVCSAQEIPTSLPVKANIRPSKRPVMPVFDEMTVRKMIDEIEGPYNATLLKVGYFSRRSSPYPIKEGFRVLQEAVNKETIGTRRWALLQALVGYAAFRVPDVNTNDGFAAYDLLFKYANDNLVVIRDKAPLVSVIRPATIDYVNSMQGRLIDLRLRRSDEALNTFLLAWVTYNALYDEKLQRRRTEPPWADVISSVGLQEKMRPLIDKALEKSDVSQNYGLLKVAATVYRATDPDKSASLLNRARVLLTSDDVDEGIWVYKTWVDIIMSNEKDTDRIHKSTVVQRELVQRYGRGQARLLDLLLLSNDQKGIEEFLSEMKKPGVDKREVNAVVNILIRHDDEVNTNNSNDLRRQANELLKDEKAH
jgi:hypothetical protein